MGDCCRSLAHDHNGGFMALLLDLITEGTELGVTIGTFMFRPTTATILFLFRTNVVVQHHRDDL